MMKLIDTAMTSSAK